jgi:hypothetical protein
MRVAGAVLGMADACDQPDGSTHRCAQAKIFRGRARSATETPGRRRIQRRGGGAAGVDLGFQQAFDAGVDAPGRTLAAGVGQLAANHAHRRGALPGLAREGFTLGRPPRHQRGSLVVTAFLIHHGEHVQKICPIHGYLLVGAPAERPQHRQTHI